MNSEEPPYDDDVFLSDSDRKMYHKIDRTIELMDLMLDRLSVLKDDIERLKTRVGTLEKGYE